MKISSIKVDAAKAERGVWIGDIPEMDDLRLRVRASSSVSVVAYQAKLVRALSRDERDARGNVQPAALERVRRAVLLDVVLLDWENLTDEGGLAVPYSREQAEVYLSDPDYAAFAAAVEWASSVAARGADDNAKVIFGDGPQQDGDAGDEAVEGNSPRRRSGG